MGWRRMIALTASAICIAVSALFGCGKNEENTENEIVGVTALNIEVVYDGYAHGITVDNIKEGDRVYYSTGSDWSAQRPEFTDVGEYVVRYRVERDGCNAFESSATIKIKTGILQGISADNVRYVYDGIAHCIAVKGTEDGDIIEYSTDGEIFKSGFGATDVGEYTVYYRVVRGGMEYSGSAKMEILPAIQGKYVNTESGVITVTDDRLLSDGREYSMSYGVDGKGYDQNGTAFEVKDGVLTYDDKEYVKATGQIYRFVVDGRQAYASGNNIRVLFGSGNAEVTVDGVTVITVTDKNYAESSSGEIKRRYDTSDVDIEAVGGSEITDVDIALSKRKVQEISDHKETVVYDGQAHSPQINGIIKYLRDGEYSDNAPTFTDIGEYTVSAVVIKDGYLPKVIEISVEIVPDITGIYYGADAILEVTADGAMLNGQSETVEYRDGAWYISGHAVELDGGIMRINGAEYVKCVGKKLALIKYNGTAATAEIADNNIIIDASGDEITVECNGDILFSAVKPQGSIAVYLNGVTCPGIDGLYIIGESEINSADVLIIEIECAQE